jgi:hypothetical protein
MTGKTARHDAFGREWPPLSVYRIERAMDASVQADFEPFERLVRVLERPCGEQPQHAEPPLQEERVQ